MKYAQQNPRDAAIIVFDNFETSIEVEVEV